MDFGILGLLEVRSDGRVVHLGGAKQRTLLAALLLEPNRVVAADRLIELPWGGEPPETAANIVDPDKLDLHRFERLAAEGRAALAGGDAASADGVLALADGSDVKASGPGATGVAEPG